MCSLCCHGQAFEMFDSMVFPVMVVTCLPISCQLYGHAMHAMYYQLCRYQR